MIATPDEYLSYRKDTSRDESTRGRQTREWHVLLKDNRQRQSDVLFRSNIFSALTYTCFVDIIILLALVIILIGKRFQTVEEIDQNF